MPPVDLGSLPDHFDDAPHHELDRAGEKAVEGDLGADISDLSSNLRQTPLINAIIEYSGSDGHLDTKNTSLEPPKK